MIYGYCRISTDKQNIERQERNIKELYPTAVVIKEIYTGAKTYEREKFISILKQLKPGDTIVFDSVSRMSRNAEEGIQLYEHLYRHGVELVFLKEPYINTSVFREKTSNQIQLTGQEEVDLIIDAVNKSTMLIAKRQIGIAFEQSEKEVKDLRQRTKEGIETARLNGAQIGLKKGTKLVTAKSRWAKERIKEQSAAFNGNLADIDVINRIKIARNTYYKYKRELAEEMYRVNTPEIAQQEQEVDKAAEPILTALEALEKIQ